MSTPTNSFPAVGSVAGSDTVLVNASAASSKITVTNLATSLGIPALANPSGSIGLAAVNGVATTALRSDGLHALSQSIVPTWSGLHTFTAATSVFSNSGNIITLNPANGAGGIIQFTGNGNNATIGTNGNFQISVATASPIQILTSGASQFFFGDGQGTPAAQLTTASTGLFGWSSGAVGNNSKDTAITRAGVAVMEINTGTAGGGGGLQLNEMTAPAGVANSARLFTQDLAGKTQLMVIFGSGVAQQIAIEL